MENYFFESASSSNDTSNEKTSINAFSALILYNLIHYQLERKSLSTQLVSFFRMDVHIDSVLEYFELSIICFFNTSVISII